ncbi:MBL fold metallo-hydrolase [Kribbella sandramycini]
MGCLAEDLRGLGVRVGAGFATHPDWDHVLWHEGLGDVPRYGTAGCAEFMREVRGAVGWRDRVLEGLPPEIAGEMSLELYGVITEAPGGELPWEGVRVVEHPGHAVGHAALVVEESGVLVAGDMLSDVFVPMLDFARDPVEDYLAGLRVLEGVVDDVDVVVPGHGSVGRGGEVRERIERDRAYVEALRDGRDPRDRRVTDPPEGWEWTRDIHAGQVRQWAARASG